MLLFIFISTTVLTAALTGMLWRNNAVYRYRRQLLDDMFYQIQRDITNGVEYQWRHDYFHRVSYETMVYEFWRPLASFYPDKSFVQESEA